MKRIAHGVIFAAALAAGDIHAQGWVNYAFISNTMGVNGGRLCMGEASRGDLGCPTYAPSVTTAGDVSVTGNLSANRFLGDGSGLTGVVASSGDRIASGTTSLLAVSSTGFVSLTQSGVNTAWFDPTRGLVTLGVSATGPISGTDGYFSGNVGIGTTPTPSYKLDVSGTVRIANQLLFAVRSNFGAVIENDWQDNLAVYAAQGAGKTTYFGPWSGTAMLTQAANIRFQTGNGAPVERMRINGSDGNVGIGTTAPNATLQVSGTFIVSSTAQISTPTLFVNNNGQILSGTSATIAGLPSLVTIYPESRSNVASLVLRPAPNGSEQRPLVITDTGGSQVFYIAGTGNMNAVTGCNGIGSASSCAAVLEVGAASANRPSLLLKTGGLSNGRSLMEWQDISGARYGMISASGAMGLGITPTTQLEVSGTISATTVRANSFIGDGSALTGVVASSGDRIASGTTSLLAVSSTGFVSLTQSGVNTAWFDPARGLVTLGVSSTGTISGTGGYFSGNVGIGTITPGYQLDISGTVNATNLRMNSSSANSIYFDSAGHGVFLQTTSAGGAQNGRIIAAPTGIGIGYVPSAGFGPLWAHSAVLGVRGTSIIQLAAGKYFQITDQSSSAGNAVFVVSASNVGIGTTAPGTTLDVSGTARITSNTEVSGTIKLSGTGGEVCNASTFNTLRIDPATGRLQICRQ